MQRILLVQTSFLGDTVLSTPVIAGLRALYPKSELWAMTTPQSAEILARDPLLSGIIQYDKKGKDRGLRGMLRTLARIRSLRFERAYSLHRSQRTAMLLRAANIPVRIGFADAKAAWLYSECRTRNLEQHEVLRNLALLAPESGSSAIEQDLRLFAPAESALSEAVRTATKEKRYVVLAPGSVWPTKRWDWAQFREVAKHFTSLGQKVILIGSPAEVSVCEQVARDLPVTNLAGHHSLAETLYIVQQAGLVICNDSMVLHLASAFKIPTVTVFCATSPRFGFGPWQNRALVVEHQGLSCKPCRRHGGLTCPTGTEACMREVPASQVLAAVQQLEGMK